MPSPDAEAHGHPDQGKDKSRIVRSLGLYRSAISLKVATCRAVSTNLRTHADPVQHSCRPRSALRDLTEARLSHLVTVLRSNRLAEDEIRSILAHIKSALAWAVEQKLLSRLPAFPKLRRVKKESLWNADEGPSDYGRRV